MKVNRRESIVSVVMAIVGSLIGWKPKATAAITPVVTPVRPKTTLRFGNIELSCVLTKIISQWYELRENGDSYHRVELSVQGFIVGQQGLPASSVDSLEYRFGGGRLELSSPQAKATDWVCVPISGGKVLRVNATFSFTREIDK